MNVFTFTGNLGNDAEQRYTQSGDSIVSFSVPAKSGFGDKAVTSWIKCSLWGKRGESVLPYLKKGQLVGVSGEFAAREWTDKEGQKRVSNECRVNDLQLLGSAREADNKPSADKSQQSNRVSHGDSLDSDIPFN
jgi:single-strand DNA-binding protein